MKLRAWASIVGVWIALTGARGAAADERIDLTLESAVGLAVRNSTGVLKSENAVELSGAEVLQSYAQFLPTLDVGASYGYSSGTQLSVINIVSEITSKNKSATYQLGTTLNLFNGVGDYSAWKSALNRRDSAQFSLYWAKQQIAIDVTQSYLQVVLDQKVVDIGVQNLRTSRARESLFEVRTKVGVTSSADLARQQAQTSADESYLTSARAKLNDDQQLLLEKLRLDVSKTYGFTDPDLKPVPSEDATKSPEELTKIALERRPDLKSARAIYTSAEWGISVARADYYPRLNLGFNIFAGATYLFSHNVNGISAMPTTQTPLFSQLGNQVTYATTLTLSWNLFDRLITKTNVSRASLAASNYEIDLENTRILVTREIRQVYGDYRSAVEQRSSSERGLIAANKAYDLIQGRYKVGASSFIDVLAAQAALIQAQVARAQALIGFRLQVQLLEFYLGKTPVE